MVPRPEPRPQRHVWAAREHEELELIRPKSPAIGVRVGDLVVRDGVTAHEPGGESFRHHVGVSLLVGTVLGFAVVLTEAEAGAARRMRSWLMRVGSNVQVVVHDRNTYSLRVEAR